MKGKLTNCSISYVFSPIVLAANSYFFMILAVRCNKLEHSLTDFAESAKTEWLGFGSIKFEPLCLYSFVVRNTK